ncbi:MAG: coiled-coil domain-containing protein [Candidatus Saccharimonadales bacterium]
MLKPKLKSKHSNILSRFSLFIIALVLALGTIMVVRVRADQFDEKIRQLQIQNAKAQNSLNDYLAQAKSYQDAINKLQSKINSLQTAIDTNLNKQASLKQQIDVAQAKLDHEKVVLGDSIRAMYVQGQISTLEMLASSQNLSDFIDKQVYQSSVQQKIKETLDEVTALKLELQQKSDEVAALIDDLQSQQADFQASKKKQAELLSYNQSQQDAFNHQIAKNDNKIADLRAQQLAANLALGGQVTAGNPNHGHYPSQWDAPVAQDSVYDSWGMFNRECVSYTAWKVYEAYGHMPAWGWSGVGNANQWPGDAQSSHIPTGSTPRVHSVAIAMGGAYGHAMWVEAVSGNMIYVSQYNYDLAGHYSEMWVNGSNFTYIYFH